LGECPHILVEEDQELLLSKQARILEKCCECDRFKRDLTVFRSSGDPWAAVTSALNEEYLLQKSQIQSLISFLDNKILEVRFLHELGSVLQSSVDLDEVLSVALTAITAGKGFGMNRAFLLMLDREAGLLKGHLAIGPRSAEEACQAWEEISRNDLDLQTLAQNFRRNKLSSEKAKFHDFLEQLSIPLTNKEHILVKALESRHPMLVEHAFRNPDVDPDFARLLNVDTFLIMPLISRNRKVGLIIADNFITHCQISSEDMQSLETFTFTVAFAIERAALYDRLQVELNRVTDAHNKLKEQQELIVRMEKMALVGRITSSIAHSIRNPLMIIGGFARSILKNTPDSDPKKNYIESILGEASQLERVLDEILNYSDSLYPVKDFWDANQLVQSAIHEASKRSGEKGWICSFFPVEGLPMVYVDFKQVSYCIRALLLNGTEERPDKEIRVWLSRQDDNVKLVIEDNSYIVSSEQLESLLEPFSDTGDLGSGIGVALCRAMLEKHGVPLELATVPEGGINYTIILSTRKEEQI
jgi:signal transduction histidine kinase